MDSMRLHLDGPCRSETEAPTEPRTPRVHSSQRRMVQLADSAIPQALASRPEMDECQGISRTQVRGRVGLVRTKSIASKTGSALAGLRAARPERRDSQCDFRLRLLGDV